MDLDALYQEIILDHYKNPHHRGLREPYEAEVHHVNPTCGDEVTMRVHLVPAEADGGQMVVEDVSYDAEGCSISQAATSVMTDLVIGKPLSEAMTVHETFLTLMQGRGGGGPHQDGVADAIAVAGVGRVPARGQGAVVSLIGGEGAAPPNG